MGRAHHAEDILAFYVGLLEIQAVVAGATPVARWLDLVRSHETGPPRLLIERLPLTELLPRFDEFLATVEGVGTDVLVEGSRALMASPVEARSGVLVATLAGGQAESGETDFHSRAFLEPILTSLAAADRAARGDGADAHGEVPSGGATDSKAVGRRCPMCGALPVVAVVRDRTDALGARSLVCSLCASEWRFARLTCARCGEQAADRLVVHEAESIDHVRIDECGTCQYYIKTVDLRRSGNAVPVVDEVATIELDLWAGERGLTKIQRNVLGL